MQPKDLIFFLNPFRIQKKEHLPERFSSRKIKAAVAAATSVEYFHLYGKIKPS